MCLKRLMTLYLKNNHHSFNVNVFWRVAVAVAGWGFGTFGIQAEKQDFRTSWDITSQKFQELEMKMTSGFFPPTAGPVAEMAEEALRSLEQKVLRPAAHHA